MRKLLITSALALALSGHAHAQTWQNPANPVTGSLYGYSPAHVSTTSTGFPILVLAHNGGKAGNGSGSLAAIGLGAPSGGNTCPNCVAANPLDYSTAFGAGTPYNGKFAVPWLTMNYNGTIVNIGVIQVISETYSPSTNTLSVSAYVTLDETGYSTTLGIATITGRGVVPGQPAITGEGDFTITSTFAAQ